MTKDEAKQITRRRRRMALDAADGLAKHFRLNKTEWDTDIAAHIIESHIPLSVVEAEAAFVGMETEEENRQKAARQGPGYGDRMRKALGYADRDAPALGAVLEAAIEAINERNELRKIAAHVPATAWIKAKEAAGFGTPIKLR